MTHPAPANPQATAPIDVTVLIVNYNTRDLLVPCLTALRRGAPGLSLQVVIVDNASRDGSAEFLRAGFDDCEVIVNTANVGFGRANNQALASARGRYVLLLNTDAFVDPDGVSRTVRFMDEHPRCGLLGVRLIGREGDLQPSCRYFPTAWNEFLVHTGLTRWFPRTRLVDDMAWDHAASRECDWVPGCYYLVRKSVVDALGLFDPRFFLYYEEVDHCRTVKAAGWQVMYCPEATVVHIGGESARSDSEIMAASRQISTLQIESGLLYHRKHHGLGGLWATLLLSAVGDAFLAVKWLLKRKTLRGAEVFWRHTALTWSTARKTDWARRATR